MNAFFLAWTQKREPVVWNGSDWTHSPTEVTHRQRAKIISQKKASELLQSFRVRFPRLEEITIIPIAEKRDVAELLEQRRRR